MKTFIVSVIGSKVSLKASLSEAMFKNLQKLQYQNNIIHFDIELVDGPIVRNVFIQLVKFLREHAFSSMSRYEIQDLLYSKMIQKVVYDVDGSRGAPMGRDNVGKRPTDGTRIYDAEVPLSGDGAYDAGGAYWGNNPDSKEGRLRVSYTKDLSYIQFYREFDNSEPSHAYYAKHYGTPA